MYRETAPQTGVPCVCRARHPSPTSRDLCAILSLPWLFRAVTARLAEATLKAESGPTLGRMVGSAKSAGRRPARVAVRGKRPHLLSAFGVFHFDGLDVKHDAAHFHRQLHSLWRRFQALHLVNERTRAHRHISKPLMFSASTNLRLEAMLPCFRRGQFRIIHTGTFARNRPYGNRASFQGGLVGGWGGGSSGGVVRSGAGHLFVSAARCRQKI